MRYIRCISSSDTVMPQHFLLSKTAKTLSLAQVFGMSEPEAEAMFEEMKGRTVGGAGKVAEVDGAYFGGYVKPHNHREERVDRRRWENRSDKRRSVVIIRERNGASVPAVFKSEDQALNFIRSRIEPG